MTPDQHVIGFRLKRLGTAAGWGRPVHLRLEVPNFLQFAHKRHNMHRVCSNPPPPVGLRHGAILLPGIMRNFAVVIIPINLRGAAGEGDLGVREPERAGVASRILLHAHRLISFWSFPVSLVW